MDSSEFNIIIIDDREIILHGMTTYLKKVFPYAGISVFTEARSFLRKIESCIFDIYIIDVELKDIRGIELIKEIRKVNSDAKIIVYTMHEGTWTVKELLEQKVNGIILKSSPLDVLRKGVEEVLSGSNYYCNKFRSIKQKCNEKNPDSFLLTEKFSKTEIEIIQLIANGNTSAQIARKTGHTKDTIMSYKKDIFKKFGVNSAPKLIYKAMVNGFPIKNFDPGEEL